MTTPAKPAAPVAKPATSTAAQAAVKPNNTDKVPADVNVDANADTQVEHKGGSPVTAGTVENNKGEGGTIATEGNKSPTVVGGNNTDNSPATGPGGHANVSGATQDPKDPAVVKSEDVSGKTEQLDGNASRNTGGDDDTDAEFEKALKEEDVTETPDEKELDEFDRRENGGLTREELLAQREEIDRKLSIAARDGETPAATVSRQQDEHDKNELLRAFNKLVQIDAVVQPSTPDSHTAWGVGGVILTLGDIRKIARAFVKNGSRV